MGTIIVIICLAGLIGMALYAVIGIALYARGKAMGVPFEVVLHSNATYIKMPSGKQRKIADHKYNKEELQALYMRAKQVEKDHVAENGKLAGEAFRMAMKDRKDAKSNETK